MIKIFYINEKKEETKMRKKKQYKNLFLYYYI